MQTFFSKQNAKRLAFLGSATALLLALVFFLSVFSNIDLVRLTRIGDFNLPTLLLLLMSGFFAFSIIVASASYLNIFGTPQAEIPTTFVGEVGDKLRELEAEIARLNQTRDMTIVAEAAAKQTYISLVKSDLQTLATDQLAGLVKETLLRENEPAFRREKIFEILKSVFSPFLSGLRNQSEQQVRIANFNVWCGMVFAAGGLGVMGYIVIDLSGKANLITDWTQFAFQFVPKFTFVVLFESIAFFFLQLYRDDRSQQRYLRNEMTNIEARALALSIATLSENQNLTSDVVAGLLLTERNFTVKKGERLILEALQKEAPILFETIVQRLMPDISKQLQKSP